MKFRGQFRYQPTQQGVGRNIKGGYTMLHIKAIWDGIRLLIGSREAAQDIYDGYIEWGYIGSRESPEDFKQTSRIISIVCRAAQLRRIR